MSLLRSIFRRGPQSSERLEEIRTRFESFQRLLRNNNAILAIIGDLEEKAQGDYLFDINYIRSSLTEIRTGVEQILEEMILLGGEAYRPLREQYAEISDQLSRFLPGQSNLMEGEFTIPFSHLDHHALGSVGSKSAQLGEMKGPLDLPVPDGFAITAWSYHYFMHANRLQQRISKRLDVLDIRNNQDLVKISHEIQEIVRSNEVPADLAASIRHAYARLQNEDEPARVAMRSSAIGEDALFSFAGQYSSFLNVLGDEIVERYREVIAGKFTPKAIYYYLSHNLPETDLPMAVGCVKMVDSVASGVVYSRDPVNPDHNVVIAHSVYGLGSYLVNGVVTPDTFIMNGTSGEILEKQIVEKNVMLCMKEDRGVQRERVPENMRLSPSIDEVQLKKLARYARMLETHYGGPQDIEWALDRQGHLFLLQTRPLHVIHLSEAYEHVDTSGLKPLLAGGVTVCPGAGSGKVVHVAQAEDLERVTNGSVLVTRMPFPGLVTVMDKISALVTEIGSSASHMAAIAREQRLPTVVNMARLGDLLDGWTVTVDATDGVIYEGKQDTILEARQPDDLLSDAPIYQLLHQLMNKITPLNLIHPSDTEQFQIESCETIHDVTRFCHQKAIEEIFEGLKSVRQKEKIAHRLRSDIPLPVHLIFLDPSTDKSRKDLWVEDAQIGSEPMQAFWEGIKTVGWPKAPYSSQTRGLMSPAAVHNGHKSSTFSQTSYAFLGRDYMLLNLRMGYHFTTIEAMCTDDVSSNYVRFEHKGGGASLERRIRRVTLIDDLLRSMGFESTSKADFLDTMLSYPDKATALKCLTLIGQITMRTKQLDMALTNDAVMIWYRDDLCRQLGMKDCGKEQA